MKHLPAAFVLGFFLLASCAPATPTASTEALTVQYSAAASAWLTDLYACAGGNVVKAEQRTADFMDPQAVDMAIRIGEPTGLTLPAYQIGSEEILVVINLQNPIDHLTTEEVHGLFSGSIQTWQTINGSSDPVQVWVFSQGEDVEQAFEQTALGGSPVTSMARLATSPEGMSQAIANDVNAIGILPGHWKAGNVTDVFSAASVPVLVITPVEPKAAVKTILACLQK